MYFLGSFAELVSKGGFLMWPILACSVVSLALILFKGAEYFFAGRSVQKVLKGDDVPLPWFLDPLFVCLPQANEEMLSLVATRQIRKLERGLGTLELITTVAPILGLTGTVTGMISTFQAIGMHGARVDPALLAGGIWEALLTTAAGLLVALPVHIAHHVLENQLAALVLNIEEATERRRKVAGGICEH